MAEISSESQSFLVTSLIWFLRVPWTKWYHSQRIMRGGGGVMGTPVSSRTIWFCCLLHRWLPWLLISEHVPLTLKVSFECPLYCWMHYISVYGICDLNVMIFCHCYNRMEFDAICMEPKNDATQYDTNCNTAPHLCRKLIRFDLPDISYLHSFESTLQYRGK